MSLSLAAAVSGMQQQQKNIEAISNNLANVNTTGYKRVKIHFQDILNSSSVFTAITTGTVDQRDVAESAGVSTAAMTRDFEQGTLQPSGRQMDFAISGDGFFRVRLDDGSLAYTRSGVFMLDGDGFRRTAGPAARAASEVPGPPH